MLRSLTENVGDQQHVMANDNSSDYSSQPEHSGFQYEAAPEYQHFLNICSAKENGANSFHRNNSAEHLYCSYSRGLLGDNRYLLIGPYQVEHFSADPPIMVIHEFVSDKDIEEVLAEAEDSVSMLE